MIEELNAALFTPFPPEDYRKFSSYACRMMVRYASLTHPT